MDGTDGAERPVVTFVTTFANALIERELFEDATAIDAGEALLADRRNGTLSSSSLDQLAAVLLRNGLTSAADKLSELATAARETGDARRRMANAALIDQCRKPYRQGRATPSGPATGCRTCDVGATLAPRQCDALRDQDEMVNIGLVTNFGLLYRTTESLH